MGAARIRKFTPSRHPRSLASTSDPHLVFCLSNLVCGRINLPCRCLWGSLEPPCHLWSRFKGTKGIRFPMIPSMIPSPENQPEALPAHREVQRPDAQGDQWTGESWKIPIIRLHVFCTLTASVESSSKTFLQSPTWSVVLTRSYNLRGSTTLSLYQRLHGALPFTVLQEKSLSWIAISVMHTLATQVGDS
jgi:hypothetical protein